MDYSAARGGVLGRCPLERYLEGKTPSSASRLPDLLACPRTFPFMKSSPYSPARESGSVSQAPKFGCLPESPVTSHAAASKTSWNFPTEMVCAARLAWTRYTQ